MTVKSATFKFSAQHLLYGRLRPYLNKVMLPEFVGHCSTEIYPIKPSPEVSREFLQYWFLNEATSSLIDKTCTGARMPRANMSAILNFEFPFPPLPEQQRIVRILDEAFDAIAKAKANAEKNLQNARALFESHLHSVFTQREWNKMRLAQVADTISTGPFGTMLHKSDYVLDGIPLVNPTNIVGSRIVPSNQMMVNEATRKRLSAYVLRVGDVVVARRGELGRCALVTETEAGWLCGTGSFIVRLASMMDPKFFVSFFTSKEAGEHLQRTAIGATMSNLNHTILGDLPLVVPPLPEQKLIIEKLTAITYQLKSLSSVYRQKLSVLGELKKSLLHQAFSGQL